MSPSNGCVRTAALAALVLAAASLVSGCDVVVVDGSVDPSPNPSVAPIVTQSGHRVQHPVHVHRHHGHPVLTPYREQSSPRCVYPGWPAGGPVECGYMEAPSPDSQLGPNGPLGPGGALGAHGPLGPGGPLGAHHGQPPR